MAVPGQLPAQLAMVVDLAVADRPDRPILARQRLAAGLQIDDAQPPHSQSGAGADEQPLLVRAAVGEDRAHGLDLAGLDGPAVQARDTRDPAHRLTPPPP